MPRKLKTYRTSVGFFELAVAAPSMKAALEAWGSSTNLFQLGAAQETRDPAIVAAAMARPGAVVRRAVGSTAPFSVHARLPKHLPLEHGDQNPVQGPAKIKNEGARVTATQHSARPAELALVREQRQQLARERKEHAALEKQRTRRRRAIAAIQAAREQAERDHGKSMRAIKSEQAALDRRLQAENTRWEKEKKQRDEALRRARK